VLIAAPTCLSRGGGDRFTGRTAPDVIESRHVELVLGEGRKSPHGVESSNDAANFRVRLIDCGAWFVLQNEVLRLVLLGVGPTQSGGGCPDFRQHQRNRSNWQCCNRTKTEFGIQEKLNKNYDASNNEIQILQI